MMTTQPNYSETALMNERDEAIESAVVALLNVTVVFDDSGCLTCGLCKESYGHTDACPILALEQHLNPDER